jgi:sulfur-carrier protein
VLTVRYFAAARVAAGVPEEKLEPVATLGVLRTALAQAHGERMISVLAVASFLVDGVSCRDEATRLPSGCTIDVLPPFAGG